MLQLSATTEKLQITPGTTGGDVDVTATYTDRLGTTDTPGTAETNAIGGTTAVDILAAPAAATVRRVRWLSVRNTSATVTSTYLITKQNSTGPVTTEVFKTSLGPGEELVLAGNGVWFVYDINGAVKASNQGGRLLKTTVLTSGTTFTTGPSTQKILVTVVGGGGGGGGCSSLASAAAAAGGGGSGAKCQKLFDVTPNTNYTYAIGAAGAGVSNAAGTNGGASSFGPVGGVTLSAPGGLGAPLATAATTLTARAGGDGGATATGGDHNKGGNPGEAGVVLIVATPILASGNGGSALYGDGGLGLVAAANGNNATGNGAGGGGSATGASAVRTGGNGSAGVIIVEEYS